MAHILCHHNGKYNFYCTIADGFVFERALTLTQVHAFTKARHGQSGLQGLPSRIERAHLKGESSFFCDGLRCLLAGNRAGDNGKELSFDECIERFLS